MRNRLIILPAIISALISVSCNREPVAPPVPTIDYITIKQLREMYESGVQTVDTNVYIQGVITLTPELGNVPEFISYVQDSTAAICVTVSDADNTLAMNSEVKILCRGVSFTDYNNLLQFGDISINSQVEVVTLNATLPELKTVTIDQLLTGEYEGMYVELPGVQFEGAGTFSGSQLLTDCTSEIEVYTRSAASFSTQTIPTGNGILKGISSVYTDQQILLRDPAELDMAGNRCGIPSVIYLSQDFTTLAKFSNVSTLPGWLTYSQAGSKTWFGYVYSNNNFVETTAFSSGSASVITWMVAPITDLTNATSPYVSFDCADGFDNGATLKLYASTDYDGSNTPWAFTWTELTYVHPPSSASGYSAFTSSGKVDLSAYNGGIVYIAWVYTGADNTGTTNDQTTTYEVDNVIIAEK